jgi:thiol-disulfide isomerase/thioredoxin
MRILLILIYLFPFSVPAAQFFKLKGEVQNPTEDKIIITLYRNWVEPPEDYTLFLDANNRFAFEIALDNSAYLDINYSLNGVLFQIIEQGDDIYLKFDANDFYGSFHPTGAGSSKWIYYLNHRKKFEQEIDAERELFSFLKGNSEDYYTKLDETAANQLALLEDFKKYFSEDFYRLRRADILGKVSQYKLDYLVTNNKTDRLFENFQLKSINSKLQNASFEYGNFVESLVEIYNTSKSLKLKYGISDEYINLKFLFETDLIGKPMAERLMAVKLSNFLDLDGYSPELESVLKDFSVFAENNVYTIYLSNKLKIVKGKYLGEAAPSFVLTGTDGNFITQKDFKGKNLLLVFWASWCQPCMKDLAYLPIIDNYFKEAKNLQIINISVDTPEDFKAVAAIAKASSLNSTRVDPNSKFLKEYGVMSIPTYILLDAEGNWKEDKLIEPALDEGRGLIKQLENIFKN